MLDFLKNSNYQDAAGQAAAISRSQAVIEFSLDGNIRISLEHRLFCVVETFEAG